MPYLKIETNVAANKIPNDISEKLCGVVAKTLNKPKEICVASVVADMNLSFGGVEQPAAQVFLKCISGLGVEENKNHANAICELLEKELGISKDKVYIFFQMFPASDVGFNGSTYDGMF
ncbi:hypothetical protein HHI36_021941 [Cryptolaemus montrouzieri]|uniref:L-dopachrome isomerase n=1 Tax=Cryptolaemus montrouzieri TaxID=559131 RepID=A0ABD2MY80_9CUCU